MSLIACISDAAVRLVFPQTCRTCNSPVEQYRLGVSCRACWDAVTFSTADLEGCKKCGAARDGRQPSPCRTCIDHHYDAARCIGVYEKALADTVLNLKRVPSIPEVLNEKISEFLLQAGLTDADVVIPVPLFRNRLAERGHNQAEIIARSVSKAIGKPLDAHSLVRTKHTPFHRAAMDRKARESSVANAFAVTRPRLVDGKAVLLVDDVFTSGATASNCAKALKKSGARRVTVFTLARAMLNR